MQNLRVVILIILVCLVVLSFGQCRVKGLFVSSFLADPTGTSNSFDTDRDGVPEANDEFVRICSDTNVWMSLSDVGLSDQVGARFFFSSIDSLGPGECVTVISWWKNTEPMPRHFRSRSSSSCWNDRADVIAFFAGSDTCTISYPSDQYPIKDGCVTVSRSSKSLIDCELDPSALDTIGVLTSVGRSTPRLPALKVEQDLCSIRIIPLVRGEYAIYSSYAERVMEGELDHELILHRGQLPPGIYSLIYRTHMGYFSRRFVVY